MVVSGTVFFNALQGRFGSIMTEIRIGHAGQQYPEKRNIIGLAPGARYTLCRDWFSLRSGFEGRLGLARPKSDSWFDRQFQFNDFGLNPVDCIHLFNAVNYSRKPWVLTFETLVPRFRTVLTDRETNPTKVIEDKHVRDALVAMSRPNCLALLPISDSAAQIQKKFLSLFPEYESSLLEKMRVLHPPQQLMTGNPEALEYPCESSPTINFMMVGHHFFRKGGREVLDVLAQARAELGADLRLCIVSKISDDGYATDIGGAAYQQVHDFISSNSEWIEHYPSLPPEDVLRKMRACDVGLLPSYAETYGYSVLEFQSVGRPVITTNVRAFPEINNDDCGWIIPVRKKEVGGEAYFKTPEEKAELSSAIRAGLYAAVQEIVEQPQLVRNKGLKAWARVRDEHDPATVGECLREIYLRGCS